MPFRGSSAVSAGVLTRAELFGPRFRRLFPDVYVSASVRVDLVLRSLGAAVLVAPHGVLSGYSAAELLGASCGPEGAPAEVTVPPGSHRRPTAGLVVHRDRLCPGEVVTVDGTLLTSPRRTALDLVRWHPVTEGVVAVDALAHRRFAPQELRALRSTHLGAPGSRKLDVVLRLADPRAESPMESRIRVALHDGGLPAPCVQHPVVAGGRRFWLDLAYPAARLGVEYDGREHLTPERALRDLEREALLTALGWKILRFRADVVLHRPRVLAARVRHELALRSR